MTPIIAHLGEEQQRESRQYSTSGDSSLALDIDKVKLTALQVKIHHGRQQVSHVKEQAVQAKEQAECTNKLRERELEYAER